MRRRENISVAHVVPARFGSRGVVGGAERYALELAKAMARAVPTRLVTFGDRTRKESDGPLEVRIVGRARRVRGQANNPFTFRLFGALEGTSVVHCHQQHILASSATAAFCRLTGRRVFVSDLGGGGFDVSAYVSTDRWYHGHLHISEYSRRVFGHENNPRAHVILGGVDVERFSPDRGVSRGNEALYVGRLLPHKGIDYLIEALPAGMRLRIVGPAPDPSYLGLLRVLAEGKDVVFESEVDDVALVDAYRRAACVVLPSVYRTRDGSETRVPELLGQTLLEGMACEAPAICTDVASMPEVVEDRVTGFVVPPNDPLALGAKLQWLREHPAEAGAMGAAGRRRVLERFTWKAVVERCLKIYER